MRTRPKPRPIKIQCENCLAKNRRVELVTFTKRGEVAKRMWLCEECVKAANRLLV